MQTHYFRARVDQFVANMDDTAVVAVEAESYAEAVDRVLEPKMERNDFYIFTEEAWGDALVGDDNRRPSTGPVHYLGTGDIIADADGALMLSTVEGQKVTADSLE